MSVQRIASRYAKSLLDLAIEQDKLETVLADVKSFKAAAKVREFYLLIKSPIINATKKGEIMKTLFEGKYDKLTMAFLNILCVKGRESVLPEIANEFIEQYKKYKHISTVKITSAAPLDEATIKAIFEKLTASPATDDNVEITTAVDPTLLGGFVMEFDDKIYDASVAHQLNQLRKEFDENLYVSQIMAR